MWLSFAPSPTTKSTPALCVPPPPPTTHTHIQLHAYSNRETTMFECRQPCLQLYLTAYADAGIKSMPCKPAGWPPRMHLSIHVLLHWAWSSLFTLGQMQHKSNLSLSLLRNVSNPRLPGKAACLSKCRNAYDYINAYQPASMESCVLKLRLLGCLPEWMHIFIKSHLPACLCGSTSSSNHTYQPACVDAHLHQINAY